MDTNQMLEHYYADNGRKIREIVDKITNKFGGLYQKDKDDFYSISNEVFADIYESYDKEQSFEAYLYACITNKIKSEITRRNRGKRRADQMSVSLDAPLLESDDCTIGDLLPSDFDMEKEIENRIGITFDENVEKYLTSLPKMTRDILNKKMEGISVTDIKKQLNITNKEYDTYMRATKKNENLVLIASKDFYKGEDKEMCEIMPIDTTDSYRMDKYSLYSLLDDKRKGKINCKYILQRKAYQWSDRQVNKFLSRILNNQPVPEIVICEQSAGGKKKSYLIDGLQRLSYSELFKADGVVVGSDGAEFTNVHYKEYQTDAKGVLLLDDDGDARYDMKVFDIVGKKYHELPEFLKDRFNKFNVNVTTFFDCTDDQIAYHIRNYNNHEGMTNNQYEITNVHTDIVKNIKDISENHLFFKNDLGKYTEKHKTKGILDRVVTESIMTINFLEEWKKKGKDTFTYVNNHVEDSMFDQFRSNLDRLCNIVDKDVKELFNPTNSSVWFAVFDKFRCLNLPDGEFLKFMKAFKQSLYQTTYNGESFEELYKSRNTKDKRIITTKINGLEKMMLDFFGIEKAREDTKADAITTDDISDELRGYLDAFKASELPTVCKLAQEEINETAFELLAFMKHNFQSTDYIQDIELYLELLNDWTLEIDQSSGILCRDYLIPLVGIVGEACVKEMDEPAAKWFVEYAAGNNPDFTDKQKAYQYMSNSLKEYMKQRSLDQEHSKLAV